MKTGLSRCLALVVATNALVAGAAWAIHASRVAELREAAETPGPFAGSVLGRFLRRRSCEAVTYAGPATQLYSDRPYHTSAPVAELEGHLFCRGKRHGRDLWILDVSHKTRLYALAAEKHRLERSGWTKLPQPVRVEAAGLALDGLYELRVGPGRYAIHYGHASTANPVFWNPRDAHIVPIPPADG